MCYLLRLGYGCLKNGTKDLKDHKWFSGFDFDKLLKKEADPPIKPTVAGADDTSNFDPYPESPSRPERFTTIPDPFIGFSCIVNTV